MELRSDMEQNIDDDFTCYQEKRSQRRTSLFEITPDMKIKMDFNNCSVVHEDQPHLKQFPSKQQKIPCKPERRISIYSFQKRRRSLALTSSNNSDALESSTFKEVPPTYQLQPKTLFQIPMAKKMIEEVLSHFMANDDEGFAPTALKAGRCIHMANLIKERVKTLGHDRYRLIAYVLLVPKEGEPSVTFGSRCLWQMDSDTYAEARCENATCVAVGVVYGIYKE